MAPSTTIGAVILLWRKAATKVIVSHVPSGTLPITRARATSARCRSAACRLFFKGDVVAVEKTPERAAAGANPPLAQLCKRLRQGQVWMLSNHSQDLGRELFERRNASAARLRRGAVIVVPALQPLDRRCNAHLKAFGRLTPRRARSHGLDNAFPQITRIGLRHRPPRPEGESMHRVSIIANRLRTPQIQIGRKPL